MAYMLNYLSSMEIFFLPFVVSFPIEQEVNV